MSRLLCFYSGDWLPMMWLNGVNFFPRDLADGNAEIILSFNEDHIAFVQPPIRDGTDCWRCTAPAGSDLRAGLYDA